jgi:hypothetical protein
MSTTEGTPAGVVYATIDGFIEGGVMLRQGEIWDAADPVVARHPDQFTADGARFARNSRPKDVFGNPVSRATETATAAPGELRDVHPAAPGRGAARSRGQQ